MEEVSRLGYSLAHTIEAGMTRRCGIEKWIRSGSRARGTNRERSNIDLAVQGGNTAAFAAGIDDEIPTLLRKGIK